MKKDFQAANMAEAQATWNEMVSTGWRGLVGYFPVARSGAADSLAWFTQLSALTVDYLQTGGADPISNPNFVHGYFFDPGTKAWYTTFAAITGSDAVGLVQAPPEMARQFDQVRLERIIASGWGVLDSKDARAVLGSSDSGTVDSTGGPSGGIPVDPTAPPRADSSTFLSPGGEHSVIVNAGGTLSDVVLIQHRAGNPISLDDLLTGC